MSNGTKEVGCSKEELTVVASINSFEGKVVGVTCGSQLYNWRFNTQLEVI